MTYRIKLVVAVAQLPSSRRIGLSRKESGDIVETRLRPGFERLLPDYQSKVSHSKHKGTIAIELTMPALGPAEARRKTLYWVDRVAGVQNITFDPSKIEQFEVTPVG